MKQVFENSRDFALKMDAHDPLRSIRNEFHIPVDAQGKELIYFVGNSTGLQPKTTAPLIQAELTRWQKDAAKAHFVGENPWYAYHETVTPGLARLAGATANEVVAMNSLTVNLHLMLTSFYQPTGQRRKIAVETDLFSSDRYALQTHLRTRGISADEIHEFRPRAGETSVRQEDIEEAIEKNPASFAILLLGHPNYLNGQAWDCERLGKLCRKHGIMFGLDLAHGMGNLTLRLHDWGVDFAVWCSYKYLNAGPGAIAGCFVHEKHTANPELQRLGGWWGHDKERRFEMSKAFAPMTTAEGWQLSNPPVFQLAALRASLGIFDRVGMEAIRAKSDELTAYVEFLVDRALPDRLQLLTPRDRAQRGAQLNWKILKGGKEWVEAVKRRGVECDFRAPDVLRVAPTALYNRFVDAYDFVEVLKVCQ